MPLSTQYPVALIPSHPLRHVYWLPFKTMHVKGEWLPDKGFPDASKLDTSLVGFPPRLFMGCAPLLQDPRYLGHLK